jgi:hypothetical protein
MPDQCARDRASPPAHGPAVQMAVADDNQVGVDFASVTR